MTSFDPLWRLATSVDGRRISKNFTWELMRKRRDKVNQWKPMIDRSRNLAERFEATLILRTEHQKTDFVPMLTFDDIETILFSLNQTANTFGAMKMGAGTGTINPRAGATPLDPKPQRPTMAVDEGGRTVGSIPATGAK